MMKENNNNNYNYKQILFDWAESYYGCDVCKKRYNPTSKCEESCVFDLDLEEFLPKLNDDFLCSCFGGGYPLFDTSKNIEDYTILE